MSGTTSTNGSDERFIERLWPALLPKRAQRNGRGLTTDGSEAEPIRTARVRKFLTIHLVLCVLGLLNAGVETAFGLQPSVHRQVISWLASGIPTAWTLVAFALFRHRRGLPYLIPVVLSLDSVLIMAQIFQEGTYETAWIAMPLVLIIMVPMFSERGRFVWVIAGIQVTLFFGLMYLRSEGIIQYEPRTANPYQDWSFALFSWMGFVVAVVSVAILSGTASVDMLNSQRQLNTALDRRERELQKANARIIQQQKMVTVGQLTAGIAHEINNPLTFVQTNLTSLRRDLVDLLDLLETYEQADEHIERVAPDALARVQALREALCLEDPRGTLTELIDDAGGGLDRVQQIIRDLRIFARLDEAEQKPVDLREGITSTLKILRSRFDELGVKVVEDFEPLPEIEIFPALFNQVIMNLLQNACDAVPQQGGRIRVSTRVRGEGLVVEIADSGPGIPADVRHRIFDPFFTTKDVGEGTGLGLSLSHQIIDRHGGRLEVGEAPEGGALFTVWLPRGGIP